MRTGQRTVIMGSTLVAVALLVAACGSSTDEPVSFRLEPLHAVVADARSDAANMEQHAEAMAAALDDGTETERWTSDLAILRDNARSLRALADWGDAIANSQALYPPRAQKTDLARQYGDGRSLQSLAETVIQHADAMDDLLAAMRAEADTNALILESLDLLAGDAARMRTDGQAAEVAGQSLVDQARAFARGIGEKLD